MDSLDTHHDVLYFHNKKFTCLVEEGKQSMVQGLPRPISIREILALHLKICFRNRCQLYATHVGEPYQTKGTSLEYFSVLQEIEDVFQEIPGLSSRWDINLSIDLVLRVSLVSKTHTMSTPKLKELKMQLEELLKKAYICPSVSPWGAPIHFVKKKDGMLKLCIEFVEEEQIPSTQDL
jgi:hypothetical protein